MLPGYVGLCQVSALQNAFEPPPVIRVGCRPARCGGDFCICDTDWGWKTDRAQAVGLWRNIREVLTQGLGQRGIPISPTRKISLDK